MNGLEITVLLGTAVLLGTVLAPRLRIALPLLLVVFGLALGFLPELREVELPPETVLLLFLPVMLFWESLTTSLWAIKRDLRGIVIMSTLLVVASAFGVAGIAYALGMPWEAALVLGAAIAPPDATAAAALGRTLPRRQFMVLKAESLTNDGTALVVYAVAVGLATGGHYTTLDVTGLVLLSYLGGLATGAAVAGLAYLVMRQLHDAMTINIALLLVPFTAYLAAELVGASGVLAVVVAGLIVSYTSARISTAASRRLTESAWPLGSYLLNGALFVLIGLEVQTVAHELDATELVRLSGLAVAVWIALIVIRFVFPQLAVLVIRLLDRRPSQRARRMSYRSRVVGAVAGFRGAISLAIALSVPVTLDDGSGFPAREDIVFVTACVILLTLLVQGPLLPAVVRWADLPEDHAAETERRLAEREITEVAVAALSDLADEHGVSDEVRDRLAGDYQEHLALVQAKESAGGGDPDDDLLEAMLERRGDTGPVGAEALALDAETPMTVQVDEYSPLARNEEYTRLRIAMLDRKREALLRLRQSGTIDDSVARDIQTRLDIEELRLTGIDPID
ncbi:monovalent cation:H+ antiporter, CPA1 family [Nocardioides sp. YR527]|uniref:Na+/H+ antiporter n=1 Tax=Nocardioides sp. YR527 TaxID=1881028 RepID=UPI00088A01B6|nr:Na+/H+ antiporter [Nocardioides sp. YR527]SDL18112.1 monovalent cation:H+ antiporter, CPA1 family [Nocardioides sp. YR527]